MATLVGRCFAQLLLVRSSLTLSLITLPPRHVVYLGGGTEEEMKKNILFDRWTYNTHKYKFLLLFLYFLERKLIFDHTTNYTIKCTRSLPE